MSAAIVQLIEEMEKCLSEPELPNADYLAEWNDRFRATVESIEAAGSVEDVVHGSDWDGILDRANRLAETIQKNGRRSVLRARQYQGRAGPSVVR